MMSIHKLSAGDGYTYLTRQVAASDSTERGRDTLADYYSAKGESPGRWVGSGLPGLGGVDEGQQVTEEQMRALFGEGRHPDADQLEQRIIEQGGSPKEALRASALGRRFDQTSTDPSPFLVEVARRFQEHNLSQGLPSATAVPDDARAQIRSDVGRKLFEEQHGRPVLDERELSGFIAKASRPQRQPVAGYDLTFSPVKSVSVLWAIAPREVSEVVEQAHEAAVASTLEWLEAEVAYTRQGAGGVRQVDVTGLIGTAFTHRDSRAGEPDLHTHVAISNKVQTLDGKWLALDGSVVFQATVAASERYNTRLETELRARLGVRFEDRLGGPDGKRPVREIVGADPRLLAAWSSRRAEIDLRRGELATQFQAAHGRPPTPKEAIALAEQANLETRDAKHEPRSPHEQRTGWEHEADTILEGAAQRVAMLNAMLSPPPPGRVVPTHVQDVAAQAVATVIASRARFQSTHIVAEVERIVRAREVPAGDVDQVVAAATRAALDPARVHILSRPDGITEPEQMRRRDGTSVYQRAHSTLFTTQEIVDAELALVTAAKAGGGRVVDEQTLAVAMLESTANGVALNPAQAQLVTEMATSGSRLQLALAPAGSGKTTAMRVLANAWRDSGGTVLGLAPSAVAAGELRSAIGGDADTLAKLVHSLSHPGTDPAWMAGIGPDSLVIIDEAGMAGTLDLARAVAHIHSRGGSVRLVGDDQQLAAVAAGGVLRDIAHEVGAVTLSELMRFHDPAEAASTLALREGDTAALGFYLDRGRVHVRDEATVADGVYQAWSTDREDGKTSLMLALSNETVTTLNARARTDRLTRDGLVGPEVQLRGGLSASAGDLIVTRLNDRSLQFSPTDWVKNGDRWTVVQVATDGALQGRHEASGRLRWLPADYVAANVDLGYASTVHGAQGSTVDTCHTALTGKESRQLFYVAATRGRTGNHFYLSTGGDGDAHNVLRPDRIAPPTATEVLEQILRRDGSQRSARTETREQADPTTQLAVAAALYGDSVGAAAALLLGPDGLARLDQLADAVRPGLTEAAAWEPLRDRLAILTLEGRNPEQLLRDALQTRDLGSAVDEAAVLHWRMPLPAGQGPLPWLPAIPAHLAGDEQLGPWLHARSDLVATLATEVVDHARTMDPSAAPQWAHPLLADRDLVGELALWRATHGVPTADLTATGPTQPGTNDRPHQVALRERVREIMGRPGQPGTQWRDHLEALAPQVLRDPWWPVLAERLDLAHTGGFEIPTLLRQAMNTGPLPDDHAAAALWSRLTPVLSPTAAAAAVTGSGASRLRPPWTVVLTDLLPDTIAERVMADPHWPNLVAAVHNASSAGVPAEQVITDAVALVDPTTIGAAGGVTVDALTTVLAWRVADLSRPEDHGDVDLIDEADLHDAEMDAYLASLAAEAHHAPAIEVDPALLRGDPAQPPPPEDADDVLTGTTTRARVLELNTEAMAFYAAAYPGSGADDYLRSRLGTDLVDDDRFAVGYAPAGWTPLVDHLAATGAQPRELVDAGLAKYTRHGTLIDTFRDRLMFGIHDLDGDLVGFTGRARPGDDHGPKYLNTAETVAFTKGAVLFGLAETRDERASGAAVTRVEGPLDAIAVTLAGGGRVVGAAPMGTALTDAQADQLATNPVLFHASDDDPAGAKAAATDYWKLVSRGSVPTVVALHGAKDPAELYAKDLGQTLGLSLAVADAAPTLATSLIEGYAITASAHDNPAARVWALRQSAAVIAALPPNHWDRHVDVATRALDVAGGNVTTYYEVLARAIDWDPAEERPVAPSSTRPEDADKTPAQRLAAVVADLDGDSPAPAASAADARTEAIRRLAEQVTRQRQDRDNDDRRRPQGPDRDGPSIS